LITGTSDEGLRIKSGASNLSYIDFSDADTGTPSGSIAYNNIVDAMTFGTGGSNEERMHITSAGSVGIGTDSPDLGAVAGTRVLTIASPTAERWGILELAGNRTWGGNQVGELKFISTDSTNNGTLVSLTAINDPTATGTGGSLKFSTRPDGGSLTERLTIDSSGNASIGDGGAGARGARLFLNNTGSQGTPQLMLVDSNDSGKQSEIRFDSGNLIFDYWGGTSRSERMRMKW